MGKMGEYLLFELGPIASGNDGYFDDTEKVVQARRHFSVTRRSSWGRWESTCFSNWGQSPPEMMATLTTPRRLCRRADISASRGDLLSASVPSRSKTISFFTVLPPVTQFPARLPRRAAEKHTLRPPRARATRRLFRRHKWRRRTRPARRPQCRPVRSAPLRYRL